MTQPAPESTTEQYHVVVNDEEQYSIWRVGRAVPAGWRTVGEQAPKDRCLAWIDENWTDMRPLSVREAMS
jgi:MbtH protein